MPKVEVTLTSLINVNFEAAKVFDYDDETWQDMSREERQSMINEDAQQFLNDTVDWDYKVLTDR